jgi:hypothetical protein
MLPYSDHYGLFRPGTCPGWSLLLCPLLPLGG